MPFQIWQDLQGTFSARKAQKWIPLKKRSAKFGDNLQLSSLWISMSCKQKKIQIFIEMWSTVFFIFYVIEFFQYDNHLYFFIFIDNLSLFLCLLLFCYLYKYNKNCSYTRLLCFPKPFQKYIIENHVFLKNNHQKKTLKNLTVYF